MVAEWINCLRIRPVYRTGEDLDIIYERLKHVKAFERIPAHVIQQICYYAYYQDLDPGVVLYRQGSQGLNWYAILTGTVDVCVSDTGKIEDAVPVCSLGPGRVFGESVLHDTPRCATVITNQFCELLCVNGNDFRLIWERNKEHLEGVIFPSNQNGAAEDVENKGNIEESPEYTADSNRVDSQSFLRASLVFHNKMWESAPFLFKERKYNMRRFKDCFLGNEAVDWLLDCSRQVHSRFHAVAAFQALLEEGAITHVTHEYVFKDKGQYYQFSEEKMAQAENTVSLKSPNGEDDFVGVVSFLCNIGPDAMFRMALRTPPDLRSQEDLDLIYEELLRIKALSYISSTVKKELAAAVVLETVENKGTVLFNQGDEGDSWYIILKGSVNVVVYGKGTVCQLFDGDDFGRLSLVNDAPRTASIETCEDNCHLLRLDKDTFSSILKDVESNSVILKEHGKDALVMEEVKIRIPLNDRGQFRLQSRYTVMAGTASKMVEYLLQIPMDKTGKAASFADEFLMDFLLSYPIFMTPESLCLELLTRYHAADSVHMGFADGRSNKHGMDHSTLVKKRVAQMLLEMFKRAKHLLIEEQECILRILDIMSGMQEDQLFDEYHTLKTVIAQEKEKRKHNDEGDDGGSIVRRSMSFTGRRGGVCDLQQSMKSRQVPITKDNFLVVKVYCADHTYSTVRVRYGDTAQMIVDAASERILLGDDCVLCEVKSSGERIVFNGDEVCVSTRLSANGRLFIAPKEHVDSLTPIEEQEGPKEGTFSTLSSVSSRELAYHLTLYEQELFADCGIYEFIYHTFEREKFGQVSANLDICLKRFNEVHLWVITEICLTQQLNKRVQLLKKFIKIVSHCKDYGNWNSFFAILMALNTVPISRLTQTWEKVPSKLKKMYKEFMCVLDPSRNHRVYRLAVAKMKPPIMPFMILLIKDITIINYGNKTFMNELVNFEKMRMITSTLRLIEYCRSEPFVATPPSSLKNTREVAAYVRNLRVIDNERLLTQLSHRLEPHFRE